MMRRRAKLAATGAILLALSLPSWAEDEIEGDLIHWSYAAFFGTGWYQFDQHGRVFAMRYSPRIYRREASISPDGARRLGIEVEVPISASLQNFDFGEIGDILDINNVTTLSAVPGIEIEIPMSRRWSLKPVAHIGLGVEFHGRSSALIYWTGIKSRLRFEGGRIDWALINTLIYSGYTTDSGASGRMTSFTTAFEFDQPLPNKTMEGEPLRLIWHFGFTRYNDFDFAFEPVVPKSGEYEEEWELGLAFAKRDGQIRLWRLHWDQLGIAYRFDRENTFTGIGITFRALFDR
ncbi:MAG: hypothetical protein ACWGPN_10850 [Gammaproteobacteria bacterium]